MDETAKSAKEEAAENAPTSGEEEKFLEGPQSRWKEFLFVLKVAKQFIKGFRVLHFVGPCVTVFGSARFKEGHPYYDLARKVGRAIAELGFTVMTGGGPGIMEAANRGAKEAGGTSVGCNIKLPVEQQPNAYLDKWITIDSFFVRKELLHKYSYAFIVLPGGFGTMDEFFDTITLIQTRKIYNFPMIVMGKAYWKDLIELINEMLSRSAISAEDEKLILVTDDVDEAMDHIRKYGIETFRLQHRLQTRPAKILGETEPVLKK